MVQSLRLPRQWAAALRLSLPPDLTSIWHDKCAAPPLPPPFFCKNIIPNGLLARLMQRCDSRVFSRDFVGGAIGDGKWDG